MNEALICPKCKEAVPEPGRLLKMTISMHFARFSTLWPYIWMHL